MIFSTLSSGLPLNPARKRPGKINRIFTKTRMLESSTTVRLGVNNRRKGEKIKDECNHRQQKQHDDIQLANIRFVKF